MLPQVVAVVATFGVAFVGTGVSWRYVCPRFVDVPRDDDLALLAVREGVAVGLVAVGLGVGLTALGTLELAASAGVAGGAERPLVVFATLLPVREVGGVVMVVGFGLVVASLLVASGARAD